MLIGIEFWINVHEKIACYDRLTVGIQFQILAFNDNLSLLRDPIALQRKDRHIFPLLRDGA